MTPSAAQIMVKTCNFCLLVIEGSACIGNYQVYFFSLWCIMYISVISVHINSVCVQYVCVCIHTCVSAWTAAGLPDRHWTAVAWNVGRERISRSAILYISYRWPRKRTGQKSLTYCIVPLDTHGLGLDFLYSTIFPIHFFHNLFLFCFVIFTFIVVFLFPFCTDLLKSATI